jgi:hypothetical protein
VRKFSGKPSTVASATPRIVTPYSFAKSPTATHPVEVPNDQGNVPWYWIRPPQALPGSAGLHRWVWDLKYEPIPGERAAFPISATPYDTAPSMATVWAMPGTYTVRLTANGVTTTQPLVVAMDPRVTASHDALMQQFTLSKQVYDALARVQTALEDSNAMRARLQDAGKSTAADVSKQSAKAGESVLDRVMAVRGEASESARPADSTQKETLNTISAQLRAVLELLQGADAAPTTQAVAIANDRVRAAADVLQRWEALKKE